MVNRCSVKACDSNSVRSTDGRVSVFKVPVNIETAKKWREEFKKIGMRINRNTYICEKHFTSDQVLRKLQVKDIAGKVIFEKVYKQRQLKKNAVPSLLNFNEITRQWLPVREACSSQNVELLIIPEVPASNFPCSDPLALEDVVAKQEQIFQQGSEVLDFFNAFHTGKLSANIPNSSWGFHIQNEPIKYIMFSQSVKIRNHFDAPHIAKKVVIYENCNVKVWLLDKNVVIRDFSHKVNFVGDLERLLVTVNEMTICEGGPSISCYSNVSVRCCDKDKIFKKWRHVSCSVYLEKGLKCFKCASLENTLRKHNAIQNRRKPHVILPPVAKRSQLIKKKAKYKQSRMLKRSLIQLQKLQDEVNGLKQKLTDVKSEGMEDILEDSNMPEYQIRQFQNNLGDMDFVDLNCDEVMEYCTPPEINDTADEVSMNLLPAKSRKKYELQYKIFIDWCNAKNVKRYSENVILAYLSNLSQKYKSSTLWSIHSMLKSMLLVKENVNIGSYTKVSAFMKKQSVGHVAKKSRTFDQQDIEKFLQTAPDEIYLMTKIMSEPHIKIEKFDESEVDYYSSSNCDWANESGQY